ncbi:MAG: Ig-like domain-containing protein, partial [Bacillota bacterium]|nr:Ig-like domain-containing protein [Bacillota bacterium]
KTQNAVSNSSHHLLDDTATTFYKVATADYTNVYKNYDNEYTWTTGTSVLEFKTNSNAKITTVSVKYYNGNRVVVTNSTGTVSGTGSNSAFVYNINDKWFKFTGNGTNATSIYNVTINLTVPSPYNVTFNGNGADSWDDTTKISETPGEKYALPATSPTKTGYEFAGWFTQQTGGTQITTDTTVPSTSIGTAYAQWTINKYTVSYNKGANGTGTNTSDTKTYNQALTLKGAIFTRTGYTQTGWAITDGGDKVYELSGSYTANEGTTLYPVWTINTYTITYKPGTGISGSEQSATKTYGTALSLLGETYSKEGHKQTGWSTSEGGAKVYDLGASYTTESAATLYPFFTADTYTVTYNPGKDGTGSQSTATKTYGQALTLAGAIFTRTDYEQIGWATSDGGAKAYDLNGSYTANEGTTLYPVWQIKTYPVTGVTLDQETISLEIGQDQTLVATVAPDNATNKAISWSSNKESVATVVDGKVTAVAVGEAIITVTTEDGNKTDTCTVTVTEPTVHVTSVSLDEESIYLDIGQDQTLFATVAPDDATNKSLTWASSDEGVATVDEGGKVTAVGEGKATITVTSVDGSKTDTCEVSVSKPIIHVTGVELNKEEISLYVGQKETLTATVSPDDADFKSVTWSSDNESVATVSDSGEVEAISAGTATITVTTDDEDMTDTCVVTVSEDPTVDVTGVTLDQETISLEIGQD